MCGIIILLNFILEPKAAYSEIECYEASRAAYKSAVEGRSRATVDNKASPALNIVKSLKEHGRKVAYNYRYERHEYTEILHSPIHFYSVREKSENNYCTYYTDTKKDGIQVDAEYYRIRIHLLLLIKKCLQIIIPHKDINVNVRYNNFIEFYP